MDDELQLDNPQTRKVQLEKDKKEIEELIY